MKNCIGALLCLISLASFAHEGGHGEVNEGGKFGGVTSVVMDAAEERAGNKAKALFKAELVRSESGKLSMYIFDEKMNLMDLKTFSEEVEAKLEVKKKGKFTYFGTFKLTKHGNHFMGQLPKVEYKPFNIDLYFFHEKKKLFAGFSDLD